ncbi:phosphoric diester hydrolase [Malassezia pachydermatis]
MLRFLTDELFHAEAQGERVWIQGHVPTGWDGSQALDRPSNLFFQIVSRFAPHTVAAIFFGHTHQDHFSVFYRATSGTSAEARRSTRDAVSMSLMAPSITPETNVNPSFRVYHVDPLTYDIYDWDQYYTNMDDLRDATSVPAWYHLYNAR